MKKRLRKKKHLGEFEELGFRVRFRLSPDLRDAERNRLLAEGWIREAIEANELCFGGGGLEVWDGFVTLARGGSATEEHRRLVARWLEAQPAIVEHTVFPLVDAWHGDPWSR
jgi:uncharacterized protein YggL (DUF469 family)